MPSFVCRLAEIPLQITTAFPEIEALFSAFRTTDEPLASIIVTREDRERVRQETGEASDLYCESLVLLRKVSDELSLRDAFLFHGSAFAFDGRGILLTAPSGTGKSTHARLWREAYGARVRMINDDKPFVAWRDGAFYLYGNPWNGKHGLGTATRAPLTSLCLLERAQSTTVIPTTFDRVWQRMLAQVYLGGTPEGASRALDLLNRVGDTVPLYLLRCNMEPCAAHVACQTLNGGE